MGAALQKLNTSVSTDSEYEATPRRDATAVRQILSIDPRSPSDTFTRTPIVVDKIPEIDLDPRSPTPGIQRTPLAFLLYRDVHTPKAIPPRPTETTSDKPSEQSPPCDPEGASKESPASACNTVQLQTFATDASPFLQSGKAESSQSDGTASNRSIQYPKQLFPKNKQVLQRKKELTAIRSPLSPVVVDGNSPRNILQKNQRRQIAKLELSRGTQQVIDKENCVW